MKYSEHIKHFWFKIASVAALMSWNRQSASIKRKLETRNTLRNIEAYFEVTISF